MSLHIGCAGWNLPKSYDEQFPLQGSHLERYSARFNAVEINSSFYRPHRQQTYARWADSVPNSFRFSVKVPKSITHEHRLRGANELLESFLEQVMGLREKLGTLLVQLPPSLHFDQAIVEGFFSALRDRFTGQIVCEPRHPSWFTPRANDLLAGISSGQRGARTPAIVLQAGVPDGWKGLIYHRLHGSPTIYYSAYSPQFLAGLSQKLQESVGELVPTWCIFDNTAEGAATGNALQLMRHLSSE